MADVIHRTTLEFRASVNTPDFPEPTWKHNPGMSAVAGVPFKYWKSPADWNPAGAGPVEMSQAEKAAVDAAEAVTGQGDGAIKVVLKKTTTTRTATTTLTADPHLKFPMLPSQSYLFRGRVFFDTTAAGDFKFGFAGPASPAAVRIARWGIGAGATAFSAVGGLTGYDATGVAVLGTGTNGGWVEFNGAIENGVNAGDFQFTWAQNASDAGNTRVNRGSYIEWARVGA